MRRSGISGKPDTRGGTRATSSTRCSTWDCSEYPTYIYTSFRPLLSLNVIYYEMYIIFEKLIPAKLLSHPVRHPFERIPPPPRSAPLSCEIRNEPYKAEAYMRSAASSAYAAGLGSGDYMSSCAKVHCKLRNWV